MRLFFVSLLFLACMAGADTVLYRSREPVVPAEYLGKDEKGILVKFTLPALIAENVVVDEFGAGILMRIPGEGVGVPVGSPDLPLVRRMVLVPNTGGISIEVVSSETIPLGNFRIPPFQGFPARSGGRAPYRIDEDIYSGAALYPISPVVLDRVGILRDLRVAWICFSPVQYNPFTGEVVLNKEVTVRLVADGTGENEIHRPFRGYTRSFLPSYREVLGFDEAGADVVDGSYLVIGTGEALDRVSDLVDWKRRKGYQVFYGVIPDIGSGSSEIDGFIEDAYNNWENPPEWLLLVGDENSMPVYYSNNTAADNQYGVVGSGYDPSIHVGRICGDNQDLSYQAWKVKTYESDPYEPSESWFQHGVSIGSTDFKDPWMSYRYYAIMNKHEIVTTLYCKDATYGGIPPSISAISDEINGGTSLLSYIGHGSVTSWGTTGFANSDVADLSNGRKLVWISSIACLNGQFDGSKTCFAEAWMNEGTESSPKGAVGIMAATTTSPVGPTDSLALYQFKGYFEEEIHHMGAAFDYGKIKAYLYTGNSGNSDMHMIFGCPETDIYCETGPLVHMAAEHDSTIAAGNWTVTVTAGGSPVEGALVGMVQDTTFLESAYTDSSGAANLTIPEIPGNDRVTLTITAHNLYPYVEMIPVFGTGGIPGGEDVGPVFLSSPVPNPVSASTTVSYMLPEDGEVFLGVYDLSGRLVNMLASGEESAGSHSMVWSATDSTGEPVPGGVYLFRLSADGMTMTRSCIVVR